LKGNFKVSEPKVIYLGPACEADTGDGRTWAEDNPWPDCECGHRPVQYVLGETFNRMKAERDALQLRLNAADQRADELESLLEKVLTNANRALPADLQRSIRQLLPAPAPSAPANEAEREPFEAWHRRRFATKHSTGHPTRDMHNGIHDPNYGPPDQQHMWEAWQARAELKLAESERDHQITGTSGMRLNMLANQGE
jgi:hypothetical protein